jgi:hypothetical protein
VTTFELLALREPGLCEDGDLLFPELSEDGDLALAPGEFIGWQGRGLVECLRFRGSWTTDWASGKPMDLVLTNRRLIYSLEKYDTGNTYFGGLVVDAAILTAVSKARAALRRRGRVAVGQVRCEWPREVWSTRPQGLLRPTAHIDVTVGGPSRGGESELACLQVSVPANQAIELVELFATTFAAGRLELMSACLAEADRQSLEAVVLGEARKRTDWGGLTYELAGPSQVPRVSATSDVADR